jgi:3-hydroxyacyl-[acyl-carrier-protein] dehydratase
MSQMNKQEIEAAIPHRSPMLLVDEVIEKSDSHIVSRKTFREDEFFLQGHYPGNPIVPGIILCEASMQTGAILLSQFEGEGIPVATRMNDVRFRKIVRPGDTIEIRAELKERLSNAFFMAAKVTVDGKVALRFEFACALDKEA